MGLGSLLPLIVLGAMGQAHAAYGPAGLPEPIATRQTLFAIPFRVDEPTDPAAAPAEVHLYASNDLGRNWQLYAKAAPTERRFLFRAGGDGEFWFQVRTLDRSGRPSAPAGDRPELRVVVDTTPPQLQLEAQRGEAGQIIARWQINDANPDPQSLILQYRTGEAPNWQQVAVDLQAQQVSAGMVTGQVTWWPQTQRGVVQVRAEVSDRAGNPAVSHAQVDLGATADQVAAMPRAGAVAAALPSQGQWRPSSPPPAAVWPSQQGHWQAPAANQNAGLGTGPDVSPAPTGPPPGTMVGYPGNYPGQNGQAPAARPGCGAETPAPQGPAPHELVQGPGMPAPTHGPYAENVPGTATGTGLNTPGPHGTPAEQGGPGALAGISGPSAQTVRAVNSPAFELDYQTEPADPSAILAVELWGTEDGGRTWRRFAADDDTRSPMLVRVEREGLYGFRLVVWDANGRVTPRPQPGDAPEIWVAVDLTAPHVQLTGAQLDASSGARRLLITWQADDWSLAPGPVSLFVSPRPGGPWEPIVRGIDNTGSFVWTFDRPLPDRVFLRMEVRDRAGNVGAYEMVEPVVLEVREPEVSVRQIRPADPSAGPGPKRYYIR